MRNISGIYSIVHIASGKPYIGSALDSEKRFSEHKSDLIHNRHDNPRLQNAWNKYGPNAFEFKILEEVSDPLQLLIREQYWMDKLQSYDRYKGFNIRKKVESNLGLKHKPETIEKIKQFGQTHEYPDRSGENNGFFGKTHDVESRKKMSKPKSQEGKAAIKAARLKYSDSLKTSKNCLGCGSEFSMLPYEDKRFCTHPCWLKYQADNRLNLRKELR